MVTHSNILAWRIPWTEEPGRLQSIGSISSSNDLRWSLPHWVFVTTQRDSPRKAGLGPWSVLCPQMALLLSVMLRAAGSPGEVSAAMGVMGLDLLLRALGWLVGGWPGWRQTGTDWCGPVIYKAVKFRSFTLLANGYYKIFRVKYKIQSNLQSKLQKTKQKEIR